MEKLKEKIKKELEEKEKLTNMLEKMYNFEVEIEKEFILNNIYFTSSIEARARKYFKDDLEYVKSDYSCLIFNSIKTEIKIKDYVSFYIVVELDKNFNNIKRIKYDSNLLDKIEEENIEELDLQAALRILDTYDLAIENLKLVAQQIKNNSILQKFLKQN